MSATPPTRLPVLWRYLWGWVLGALLIVWFSLIALAWHTGRYEAGEISDGQLITVARLWLKLAPQNHPGPLAELANEILPDYVSDIAVIEWADGRLLVDTHQMAAGLELQGMPDNGLGTVRHGPARTPWRAFSVRISQGGQWRQVLVMVAMAEHHDLGLDIAEHVARPAILLLPLVALLLWWGIRRGLRPLEQLSRDVAALDGLGGQRLATRPRFQEFASTVASINQLVDGLQAQVRREREFASDVAHELRTPLAAMALKARVALQYQTAAGPEVAAPELTDMLQALERESLRAGRILSQLLDLARAQRSEVEAASEPGHARQTNLGELAQGLLAQQAQAGHESGHELSLVQPETAVIVPAPPLLLELALRNLIENAMHHTPAGTQVLVEVWRLGETVGVSVSDDGQRPGASLGVAPGRSASRLGLGLRLVERIAQQLHMQFVRDTGEPPMTTRFTLVWKADAGLRLT